MKNMPLSVNGEGLCLKLILTGDQDFLAESGI